MPIKKAFREEGLSVRRGSSYEERPPLAGDTPKGKPERLASNTALPCAVFAELMESMV